MRRKAEIPTNKAKWAKLVFIVDLTADKNILLTKHVNGGQPSSIL